MVKGRWACLPLSWRFYHLKKHIEKLNRSLKGPRIEFETKLAQAAEMITDISEAFGQTRIVTITDSWFGNNGLFKPLRSQLGQRLHMISRLRSNNNVFKLPGSQLKNGPGRPRKYGRNSETPLRWPPCSGLWPVKPASIFMGAKGALSPMSMW
jgi:hypothetical protein